jgi:rhodanese-related sulfurtransferase
MMSFDRRTARTTRMRALCIVCAALLSAAASAGTSGGAQSDGVGWIDVEELKGKLARAEPPAIVDVRSTDSYAGSDGKIKGAVHVRLRRLRTRLAQPPLRDLPRDREVVTYCACPDDGAAVHAARVFLAAGFKRVRVLRGGWTSWLAARGPVEAKPRG